MSFLKRAIRDGISKGIGDAVGKAVRQAIEPTATELANKAADRMEQAAGRQAQAQREMTGGLEGALSNLERAAQGYATKVSSEIKICPNCGQPSALDKKFCPSCGTKLPDESVASGAVCPSCGKQNSIGMRFCQDCGTKLPAAVMEDNMIASRDAQVMAGWESQLGVFPKWCFGGKNANIEALDGGMMFAAEFETGFAAKKAVEQYKNLLIENGFRSAGEYPSPDHLYKMIDQVCYHADLEHCFDGDGSCPTLYFTIGEPHGGFDYVKPEPKKQTSFGDLFNL